MQDQDRIILPLYMKNIIVLQKALIMLPLSQVLLSFTFRIYVVVPALIDVNWYLRDSHSSRGLSSHALSIIESASSKHFLVRALVAMDQIIQNETALTWFGDRRFIFLVSLLVMMIW